ncbi:sorbitol/mannitol transport system permease protein [Nakamurella sp. UYEF19]|uniref:carbohydrate ABC transporter permease n=1 Tax=Nakamurella sp. UYEF19 TaxID=1756392 RepID=UPI0033973752
MTALQEKSSASAGPSAAVANEVNRKAKREAWLRRGPLLPALIFTVLVTQLPFLVTIYFSFRRYDADRPKISGWTLRNFQQVFTNQTILKDMWHTVQLVVVVVLVSLAFGLGIALLLNRRFPGRGAVRTMMITPFLIVPVAAALFFRYGIFDAQNGLLSGIVTTVNHWFNPGAPASTVTLVSQHPLLAVQIELIWQWTPFMTLILLAGLQSRPGDVIEAASVDGASPWQMFRFLTMPHMRQYLELAGLLGSIYIIQNFDAVYQLTPLNPQTENLPYLIFNTINSDNDYGLASAQGVIIVIATIVIATFALRTVSSLFKEENSR